MNKKIIIGAIILVIGILVGMAAYKYFFVVPLTSPDFNDTNKPPLGYSETDYTIEEVLAIDCQVDNDCETPGEYLLQSRCPFTSKCLANKCTVVCPNFEGNKCGIENCHGLEIVCGENPVQMCTAMYALGDKCRQYAVCGEVDGECKQIDNEKFTSCKSCVEDCLAIYLDNNIELFSCESSCE